MTRRRALAAGALLLLSLAACEDDIQEATGPEGSAALARYAAIGTSISMGYQSGGVLYATQVRAWPALLADQSFVPFEEPLIEGPGCSPPFIAPLQFGVRLDQTPVSAPTTICAPNFDNVELPGNNLAIAGAITQEALALSPSEIAAGFKHELYSRVLPEDQSQVEAMVAMDPTFVSVELGANENLGAATSGVVVPGATYIPAAAWEPVYREVIDSVELTGARALLVTIPDVANIPSLRPAAAIWANRQAFAAFNVSVAADCETSENVIFTPQLVLRKVAEGQALAAAGAGPATLSCANQPPTAGADYILTPTDVQTLSANVAAMNAIITDLADEHGYALLDANAVLEVFEAATPAFSLVETLTCPFPYGPYLSLDGVHPSSFGHQLIANAAAAAINAEYGFDLPQVDYPPPSTGYGCS